MDVNFQTILSLNFLEGASYLNDFFYRVMGCFLKLRNDIKIHISNKCLCLEDLVNIAIFAEAKHWTVKNLYVGITQNNSCGGIEEC